MSATETSSSAQPSSILSDKVQRALQVRVDTPAMKAALEALGQLQDSSSDMDTFHQLDARSVRHAIEYDALQQALLLQKELQNLRDKTRQLREGIAETTLIAHRVKEAIHTDAMRPKNSTTSMITSGERRELLATETAVVAGPSTGLKAEEDLAAALADAFSRRDLARQRLDAVQQFLETFDLSEEDSRLLDHYNFEDIGGTKAVGNLASSAPDGLAFLEALERVREIRQALTQTLGDGRHDSESRSGLGASSALRMMEGLAQKQERAYERLYHWLQVHLQLFGKGRLHDDSVMMEDDDETMDQALQHPFVQRSLYTLRHVTAFYRHTLELIAGRRRQDETRRFLLALTAGYGGAPPMERLAHDSVAYTGDMLAFCFRAFSAEADVARVLIHYHPGQQEEEAKSIEEDKEKKKKSDSSTKKSDNEYSGEQPLSSSAFLSTSMSGMARPLKSRVLQVVATLARRPDENEVESDDGMDDFDEEGAVVRHKITQIYEICGLLLFYISAMEKTFNKLKVVDEKAGLSSEENDALIDQLISCLNEASRSFEVTVRVYCAMLAQLSSQTGESESSLGNALMVMIAEVRLTSPGFAQDVNCPTECRTQLSMEWVTETVLEAAMTSCQVLDDTIALKQTVTAAKKAGLAVVTAEKLDEEIEKTEAKLIDALVEVETSKVLDLCGLGPLAGAWQQWKVTPEGGEMASFGGLSADDVEASMKDFYASLFSPPLPSLESAVKDPVMRRLARSKIASNVCQTYAELYEDMQTSGGYEDLSVLGHTPDQVKTLFSA
uniref:Conserved Oligomeric Golgi complex subunit 6 C-terminal domain-containing protein n=1 Tax=Amphora coffeiformis TaxID=265554 RepID=A0A7S3L8J5_9STRA|eukprot:scaffold1453_cov195-Amphora_coffeaeformis.AAC.3